MIQYFKNIEHKTVSIDKPDNGAWVNILPPLKQEEFSALSETLDIPLDFLADSLDIDERSRFEEDDNVKLIVIKTPTENNSFNESDVIRKNRMAKVYWLKKISHTISAAPGTPTIVRLARLFTADFFQE